MPVGGMGWEQVRLQGQFLTMWGHCNTDGGRGQDHVTGTDTTCLSHRTSWTPCAGRSPAFPEERWLGTGGVGPPWV